MVLTETPTLEQPVAECREIARLFVPKFPVPLNTTDVDQNARWHNWLLHVRKFAEKEGVRRVDRPVRVVATVRAWERDRGYGALCQSHSFREKWRSGVRDALWRSLVPGEFLKGVIVRYEPVPPETPLEQRPALEGTEIIIYEDAE